MENVLWNDIKIMSIKGYMSFGNPSSASAAIMLSSYPEPEKLNGRHLFLSVDDVVNPVRTKAFRTEDAERIAYFVSSVQPISTLYVCCDGGVSRSSAVAAALLYAKHGNDDSIWRDARYHPNRLVYEVMRSALGRPCEMGEVDAKRAESDAALARKIEQAAAKSSEQF